MTDQTHSDGDGRNGSRRRSASTPEERSTADEQSTASGRGGREADYRHVVVFTGPEAVAVQRRTADPVGPTEVRVETLTSGISAGTELLVYHDEVPAEMPVDATLPAFDDDQFGYPVAYGYAAVGRVSACGRRVDDDWLGERVFGFHPHASQFTAEPSTLVRLPSSLSTTAAVMLPTVETATTLVLDTAPRIGERIVVFGAGAVGLLTVALLAEFPLAELVAVEPRPDRRQRAAALGADTTLHPENVDRLGERRAADEEPGMDAAVEISGNPGALNDAVGAVGYDGRVTVGSWYGEKPTELDLGGSYHRDRIALESSQVSTLAPDLRGRWTTDRRLSVALDHAERLPLESLVTHRLPFADAPRAYRLLAGTDDTETDDTGTDDTDQSPLQVVLEYETETDLGESA